MTVDGTQCGDVVIPGLEVCHLGQSDNVATRDDPAGGECNGEEEHPPNEILGEE
ncbi:hypothetical protein [Natrinema gari]|uniref:hypothetical protein n=1 Tax=Natrinema gari TaxID=419186 RepID=UPI000ACFB96A|nr:hypothetical protein [Natrinema gari]